MLCGLARLLFFAQELQMLDERGSCNENAYKEQ